MRSDWHHARVPRLGSALLSLALAGVITLAAYADVHLVAAAVLLVQVLVAAAPGLVTAAGAAIPSPRFVPALAAGAVATAITVWPGLLNGADGTSDDVVGASDSGMLSGIFAGIALAVFVALVAQMLRRDGRTDLVQSVAYAVSLSVFSALVAGWIGAAQSLGGAECVAVGAAGVCVGVLAWLLPADRWVCLGVATMAGAVVGAVLMVTLNSDMTWFFGLLVGSGSAVAAVAGQVVGAAWARGSAHPAAAWGFPGAMSIALAAPVVYLGGQLVTVPGLS